MPHSEHTIRPTTFWNSPNLYSKHTYKAHGIFFVCIYALKELKISSNLPYLPWGRNYPAPIGGGVDSTPKNISWIVFGQNRFNHSIEQWGATKKMPHSEHTIRPTTFWNSPNMYSKHTYKAHGNCFFCIDRCGTARQKLSRKRLW